jgi:hypothetical protein
MSHRAPIVYRHSLWIVAAGLLILSETLLDIVLRAGRIPLRSALLTGLALALLAVPVLTGRGMLAAFGLAAGVVAIKSLAIPLYHLSPACGSNAGLALLIQGGALTGTMAFFGNKRSTSRLAGAGGLAGLLSAPLFFLASGLLAPCSGMLRIQALAGGVWPFTLSRGLPWAISGALMLPLAWAIVCRFPVAERSAPRWVPMERVLTAFSILLAIIGVVAYGSSAA